MNWLKNLTKPALLSLTALLLTNCQSPSSPSSSTIERTAAEIEAETIDRMCAILKPTKVSRAVHDASPAEMRHARSSDAAAFGVVCPGR